MAVLVTTLVLLLLINLDLDLDKILCAVVFVFCLQRADVTRRNFAVTTEHALTMSYIVISIRTAPTDQTN